MLVWVPINRLAAAAHAAVSKTLTIFLHAGSEGIQKKGVS